MLAILTFTLNEYLYCSGYGSLTFCIDGNKFYFFLILRFYFYLHILYCMLLLTDYLTFRSWGINSSGVQNEPPHVPIWPIQFCSVCIRSVFQCSVGFFNILFPIYVLEQVCRCCKSVITMHIVCYANFLLSFS